MIGLLIGFVAEAWTYHNFIRVGVRVRVGRLGRDRVDKEIRYRYRYLANFHTHHPWCLMFFLTE